VSADVRRTARTARIELERLAQLRVLPPAVAWFHLRARWHARRSGDTFSLVSSVPPGNLARLLALAGGRRAVAELGTAAGWTSIALALAVPDRRVVTFDPVVRPQREAYLALAGAAARARIECVTAPGASAPRATEFLYIDSSHEREPTIAEVRAWRPLMGPGAVIVFDDYGHPHYPGVAEAIDELGLEGGVEGPFFVHRVS
jgi:predicted O-methyltransferase YrrM